MSDIELEGEEIERLVHELVALTGEDAETAVLRAVQEKLEELKRVAETNLRK